jgi:hypothetical protein
LGFKSNGIIVPRADHSGQAAILEVESDAAPSAGSEIRFIALGLKGNQITLESF